MKKTINWGVLGCAMIAEKAVIPGMEVTENAHLYAIASRTNEKLEVFKKKFSFDKYYVGYEALLADPMVDAVYIPLPNGLHVEWAIKAAQAKKHVLCEKPMCTNPEDVALLKKATQDNGVIIAEGFPYRHAPHTKKIKSIIESGIIGDLRCVDAHFYLPFDDRKDVRYVRELDGGATYDLACYTLSSILYHVDEMPTEIITRGTIDKDTDVDLYSYTLLTFPGGCTAFSSCGFETSFRCEYSIQGAKGYIHLWDRYNKAGTRVVELSLGEGEEYQEKFSFDFTTAYGLEVEDMGKCILEGKQPEISLDESYRVSRVLKDIVTKLHEQV